MDYIFTVITSIGSGSRSLKVIKCRRADCKMFTDSYFPVLTFCSRKKLFLKNVLYLFVVRISGPPDSSEIKLISLNSEDEIQNDLYICTISKHNSLMKNIFVVNFPD